LLEGYKAAHAKSGIPVNEEYILVSDAEAEDRNGSYEFRNGKQLALRLLQLSRRPTAVFCVNDMTAFGLIQELAGNNVRVPEDISVIGFDNIEISSMLNPPLTTISQPAYDTGRHACRLLLDHLEGNTPGDVSIILEPSLVERKSVIKVP
jgi:DNA-binding LacI/PurR family transcriptional regulator